jgi:hypothetical protein
MEDKTRDGGREKLFGLKRRELRKNVPADRRQTPASLHTLRHLAAKGEITLSGLARLIDSIRYTADLGYSQA